jgi:FlaA1/EpsC-like NDP-sugar epimerase
MLAGDPRATRFIRPILNIPDQSPSTNSNLWPLAQLATMSSKLENKASFEATLSAFVRRQFVRPKPLPAGIKLTDQVAIVTGSNVGLGLEASRQLLQLELRHLVMGVRSQTKGDAAAAELRTTFPSATISVWLLDLESYDSVRAFADK